MVLLIILLLQAMASTMSEEFPSIAEFYRGRHVFLTGATGFIGKVFIEKMLRCCPDIGTIYVLVRPRRNKSVHERLKTMFKEKVFILFLVIFLKSVYYTLVFWLLASNVWDRYIFSVDVCQFIVKAGRFFSLFTHPCVSCSACEPWGWGARLFLLFSVCYWECTFLRWLVFYQLLIKHHYTN